MDRKSKQQVEWSQRGGSVGTGARSKTTAVLMGYLSAGEGRSEEHGGWHEGGDQEQVTVTQAMKHREVGAASPTAGDLAGGYQSFKSGGQFMDSQDGSEPARCPDSTMRRDGHDEKVRLIQAKEIVSGHQ